MPMLPEAFSKLRWEENLDSIFDKKTGLSESLHCSQIFYLLSQHQGFIPESNFRNPIFQKITDLTQSVPPWVAPLKPLGRTLTGGMFGADSSSNTLSASAFYLTAQGSDAY